MPPAGPSSVKSLAKRKRAPAPATAPATAPAGKSSSVIVVGIDFGTTFSGVSWARTSKPGVIHTVSNWQGISYFNTSDKQKVPSAICYDSAGKPRSWGYAVSPSESPMVWFKLLLLDSKDLPPHFRDAPKIIEARDQMRKAKLDPIEVIADFLRLLWTHSLEQIARSVGDALVDMSSFKVVVTIPAIWPIYAQLRMKEAVKMAGILDKRIAGETSLSFVSEPEAAALAVLSDIGDQENIQENDDFVICDAGGGTVDIITYTLTKSHPMTVEECVKGDGNLLGAAVLDEGFRCLLQSVMPGNTLDGLDDVSLNRIWKMDWEDGIKANFSGLEPEYDLPLPYISAGELPRNMRITADKLAKIFKPVALGAEKLVKSQIQEVKASKKRLPKFIVLVGGLGKSPYLYRHLRVVLKKATILQSGGERPWTAVSRGAVLRGLSSQDVAGTLQVISVESRISRASYGTTVNIIPWEAQEHDARDRAWCPVQQDFRAVDQAKWFLRTGDPITDESSRVSFWQDFEKPESEIKTELVYSEAEQPPRRCDESVKQLCEITWEKLPEFRNLPIWTNSEGREVRQLVYEIQMISDGASLDFAILYKGKRMASKNVSVEFHKAA